MFLKKGEVQQKVAGDYLGQRARQTIEESVQFRAGKMIPGKPDSLNPPIDRCPKNC